MKTILALFLLLLVVVFGGKFLVDYLKNNSITLPGFQQTTSVKIGGKDFSLLIAKTDTEKQIGLSGKKSISEFQGMIFPFNQPGNYSFWMKEMEFPIDILFLQKNRVITIYRNIPAAKGNDENPPIYNPTEPSDTVIELNAGTVDKYNLQIGDIIPFTL